MDILLWIMCVMVGSVIGCAIGHLIWKLIERR